MISYFNSFCEFIIDMCETYLVSTDNYIPNKSGSEIIELASSLGLFQLKDSKRLQAIIKLKIGILMIIIKESFQRKNN